MREYSPEKVGTDVSRRRTVPIDEPILLEIQLVKTRLPVVPKPVLCMLLLAMTSVSASAQGVDPGAALLRIDGTLQQILGLLEAQASREANQEDARLLMQRLRLQADRLAPIEGELKELRLRRSTLEQELAAGDERIRQAEEQVRSSEFARLIENQIEAKANELNSVEMSLRTLEVRIAEREDTLLAERSRYDELAAAIDEKLGLRGDGG